LVATIFFYLLAYNFFKAHYQFPVLFRVLLLGCCCAIILVFVINFFYKVSVHTTAAAILPGICISLMLNESVAIALPLLVALVIAAIVGLIRWLLGAHTVGQILLGYAIGIITQIGAYFYFNA
jgi:ABC-type Mn2+/Zn2+ transport system permease subunit